jgi:hypothetical protein
MLQLNRGINSGTLWNSRVNGHNVLYIAKWFEEGILNVITLRDDTNFSDKHNFPE